MVVTTYNPHIRLLSPGPWLVRTTKVYPGVGAEIVMESIDGMTGEIQPQLGISKAEDTMVRKLLVGSAQYILRPFGPDTDLRRYGLRLCERGGKNAKKRAAVVVARKLAVLLHRLWVSGEVYEPLHNAMSAAIAAAASSRPGEGEGERRPKARGQSPRDLLRRAGPKLRKREPESIQEGWQTTTSTALFG